MKSGTACILLLDMDDVTFKRHFRLTRTQFEILNVKLKGLLDDDATAHSIRAVKVPMEMKTAIYVSVVHGESKLFPGN